MRVSSPPPVGHRPRPARSAIPRSVDGARLRRGDGGLHLHRLDGGDGLPGIDGVAGGDRDGDDAGERRGDMVGVDRSAFSAAGTSLAMLRSRTKTGRSWPLRMHITVRMPRSSGSEIASNPISSSTPRSSVTGARRRAAARRRTGWPKGSRCRRTDRGGRRIPLWGREQQTVQSSA